MGNCCTTSHLPCVSNNNHLHIHLSSHTHKPRGHVLAPLCYLEINTVDCRSFVRRVVNAPRSLLPAARKLDHPSLSTSYSIFPISSTEQDRNTTRFTLLLILRIASTPPDVFWMITARALCRNPPDRGLDGCAPPPLPPPCLFSSAQKSRSLLLAQRCPLQLETSHPHMANGQ